MTYHLTNAVPDITEYIDCRQSIGLYYSKVFDEPFNKLVLDMVCNDNPRIFVANEEEDRQCHYDLFYYTPEGKTVTMDIKTINHTPDIFNTPYIAMNDNVLYSKTTSHVTFIYGPNLYIFPTERLRSMISMERKLKGGNNNSKQWISKFKIENILESIKDEPENTSVIAIRNDILQHYWKAYQIYKTHIDTDYKIRRCVQDNMFSQEHAKEARLNNLNSFANSIYLIINDINHILNGN